MNWEVTQGSEQTSDGSHCSSELLPGVSFCTKQKEVVSRTVEDELLCFEDPRLGFTEREQGGLHAAICASAGEHDSSTARELVRISVHYSGSWLTDATKTSPIISRLSHSATRLARAIWNRKWHCRISRTR